jgi:hypothetical protein
LTEQGANGDRGETNIPEDARLMGVAATEATEATALGSIAGKVA